MAFDWDEDAPLNTALISDFPQNERDARGAAQDSVDIDHFADTTGKHRQVSLQRLASDPTPDGTHGFVYTKLVGSRTELFYEDDAGTPNIIQLTNVGSASPDKVAKAGDNMTGDLDMQAADIQLDNVQSLLGQEVGATYRSLAQMNVSDEVEIGAQTNVMLLQVLTDAGLTVDYPASGGAKEVWHAGNDGASSGLDADLVDGVEGNAILSALSDGGGFYFESADLSASNGASGSAAHSLGGVPRMVIGVLKCITGDIGYTAGDHIQIGVPGWNQSNRGIMVGGDSANVFYTRGSSTLHLVNKGTGVDDTVNNARWKVVIRAWK